MTMRSIEKLATIKRDRFEGISPRDSLLTKSSTPRFDVCPRCLPRRATSMEAEDQSSDRRSANSERPQRSRSSPSPSADSADEEQGARDGGGGASSSGGGGGDPQTSTLDLYTALGLSAEDVDALAQIPESEISIETLPHLIMQLKAKRAERAERGERGERGGRTSTPPPKKEEGGERGGGGRRRRRRRSQSAERDGGGGHGNKHERRAPRHSSKPSHERAHASSPPKFPLSYVADDMREAVPRSFPHTCSLCHCTLYSLTTWKDHLNGSRHDEGRREFLRKHPDWDSHDGPRISDSHPGEEDALPVRRDSRGSAARRRPYSPGERPLPPPDRHHHHLKPKAGTKVVVAKFPRGAVSVEDLMNLAKPYGTVVKHLVFPCKGFLEFSAHKEAAGMVAHYTAKPAFVKDIRLALYLSPMVGSIHTPKLDKGEKRPKRLSHAMVSFSHLPSDKDAESEVLEVAKMFGEVRFSEVSTDEVLVEMEDWKDAEIMVKYYHTNPLKICGKSVRVGMTSAHKRLRPSPEPSRRGDSSRSYCNWPRRSSHSTSTSKAKPKEPAEKKKEEEEEEEDGARAAHRHGGGKGEGSEHADAGLDSAGEDDEQGMKVDDELGLLHEEPGQGGGAGDERAPRAPVTETTDASEASEGPGAEAEQNREEEEATALDSGRGTPGETTTALAVSEEEPMNPDASAKDPTEEFHESEEESMDFPDNMDDFVTLDELDNDTGGNFDSVDSVEGGKVVTVRRIRKGYGLEDSLLKLAEPFGRVTNHTISFYRQEALMELESYEAANRMIQFYQGNKKALVLGRPVSVSMCLTLQKLEGPSGRSIYIGKLPLQKYSDISLLRLAQPFGKISAYHLNWRYRKCYIQMESVDAAQKMVQKYLQRPPKFYGSVLRICLCRKGDSQIPWKAPKKYELWVLQQQRPKGPKDKMDADADAEAEVEAEAENGQATGSPAAQKAHAEEDVQTAASDSDPVSGAPASDAPCSREDKGEPKPDVPPVPLGPYQPNNPVGIDYIVQRTGFFCKLCKVFYTNEKTAKSLHCSSLAHYQKLKKMLAEDDPTE
ncbi:hypothetical protein AAFF_G00216130 [Aldrovandia affinis]|uniref:Matrin-type domain-containing protein n=1 Tax=Aldrovandia affinis TaxID=143900 RepID=A0AAD7RGH0_9TELE|nr:hypothetical protein AAFF_G00216130 [Aldrovandia affinis]